MYSTCLFVLIHTMSLICTTTEASFVEYRGNSSQNDCAMRWENLRKWWGGSYEDGVEDEDDDLGQRILLNNRLTEKGGLKNMESPVVGVKFNLGGRMLWSCVCSQRQDWSLEEHFSLGPETRASVSGRTGWAPTGSVPMTLAILYACSYSSRKQ